MLRMILLLALNWAPPTDPGTEKVERALESGTSLDDAERQLLQLEARQLFDLSDALAPELIGVATGDFETKLLGLFDDARLAEVLSRVMSLSFRIMEAPALQEHFGSQAIVGAQAPDHPLAARLLAESQTLSDGLGGDAAMLEQLRRRGSELTAARLGVDPQNFGRLMLDAVYDPAATPLMAAHARGMVRMIARLLVVRHLVMNNEHPPAEYVEGLFARSQQDLTNVSVVVASWLDMDPPSGGPQVDLRADSIRYRYNRAMMAQAVQIVEHDDLAWDTIFADEREVG